MSGNYPPELLTPAEVAEIMRVDPKTVSRWEIAGKLEALRTPGRHRRFFRAEVYALLRGERLSCEELDALRAQYGGAK